MCLVALAIDRSRRFPLVIAANRDEFFARPTAPLDWWSPDPDLDPVLAGRDLEAGGTWLGLTAAGRFGFVTNTRGMMAADPAAPSRGSIVVDWLAAREPADRFWARTALSGHNGFNLVAADFVAGDCFWASNCSAHPVRLGRGVHAVSNHLLDTPWPKVLALKSRLRSTVEDAVDLQSLTDRLFDALADPTEAPVDALPATGLAPERERRVSPAFIRMIDAGYGTRCSTLVITEQLGRERVTHVLERTFSTVDDSTSLRVVTLDRWPPGKAR